MVKLNCLNGNERRLHVVTTTVRVLLSVFLAVFLIRVATPAQAAMESYTENYGSASAPVVVLGEPGLPPTAFPILFGLPQFNPSQGTLIDVILTLSSTDIIGSEVYNSSSSSQPYFGANVKNMTVQIAGPYGLQTSETLSTAS